MDEGWQRVIGVGVALLCAAFVAILLADPTSSSSQVVKSVGDHLGILGVIAAGAVLGVATYVVRSDRIRLPRVSPDLHQASPHLHQGDDRSG